LLASVLDDIDEALQKMSSSNIASDIIEELTFIVDHAKQHIFSWKAHLLRCINQDEARLDVIDGLDETSVVLVQDWAMKFLPRKFRENQSDWFGKRGLPWHITVAIRRAENQELQMMTFVHVFKSCTQDSCAVLAIMKDVIGKLKSQLPQLESVFYRQDNAGCYHCGATIVGACITGECHGVSVKRMDFSDPQGGKGACDRKAATIKSHMRIHLNEGNNIETASEMVDAIQSGGGVPGVYVTLCDTFEVQKPSFHVKLDSVSVISNIEYSSESLRVWRAYGIGTGKKIPRAKLDVSQVEQFLNHVDCDSNPANGTREAYFHKFKSRAKSSLEDAAKNSDTEAEPVTDASSCPLFSCPEEGCIKTYQRFSALQHHQDCGKHERALEHETLLDKAVYGYADRLQEQSGGVPQMEEFTKSRNVSNQPHLPMGWALKSSQVRRARFTEKQKDYLSSKFFFGESTGQKVDAASVSKSMMTARDSNGSRLFTSSEFLTSQQISSFFSRLASRRSQDQATDSDNELEDQNMENEEAFSDLRSEILRDVALVHPICYDNHNLCELIANSKLTKFAIQMLRDICEHFDIPTADITIRKKAPYIERIVAFGKKCTCQG